MKKEIMVTAMKNTIEFSLVQNERQLDEKNAQKWHNQNIKKNEAITIYRNINA